MQVRAISKELALFFIDFTKAGTLLNFSTHLVFPCNVDVHAHSHKDSVSNIATTYYLDTVQNKKL